MIYFGQCASDGSLSATPDGYTGHLDGIVAWNAFTSPAGVVRIAELGWYGKLLTGTGSVRLGVYTSNGLTLVGQSGIITVSSSTPAWWVDSTVSITISGSTSYLLAMAMKTSGTGALNVAYYTDANVTKHHIEANSTQTYVTNGFPAAVPANASQADQYLIRAGTIGGLLLRRRRQRRAA